MLRWLLRTVPVTGQHRKPLMPVCLTNDETGKELHSMLRQKAACRECFLKKAVKKEKRGEV